MNETSVSETLYPESEHETTPAADKVSGCLPEKDGHATAGNACDAGREDKQPAQGRGRRVHGLQYAEP